MQDSCLFSLRSKLHLFAMIPMPLPLAALRRLLAGALTLLLLAPAVALAEKADRQKPMNIESDTLRYDDIKQLSVFSGRVVITKGTIIMRGARIDIRQDPEGNQFGLLTAEPGKRAFYRQKREGVDEYIEGEADAIDYDGKADRVKFIKRAEMRRYRSDVQSDEITGSVITYDNVTDVFAVDGAALGTPTGGPFSSSSGTPAGDGRVRAILTPKSSVPAASTPTAPAAPATLRPTPALPAPALRPGTSEGKN